MASRDLLRCKNCPVPFNSYVHPSTEELGKHMRQAHNIVTFSVSRDELENAGAVVDNRVEMGAPETKTNVTETPSIATIEEVGSQSDIIMVGEEHGGGGIVFENLNAMGVLPLLLGEHPSKELDIESNIKGEEHKSPQQKNAQLPDEMFDNNSKKYKCAKSGCGHITNSIKEMVSHKRYCIGSPGFGQLQRDNSEMPQMVAETQNGHEPIPVIVDNVVEPAVSKEDESKKSVKQFHGGEEMRELHEDDDGPSVKKIKVMRRDESLPGLKCEHCPKINYSFVTSSDLRRHIEEVHG